MITAAFAVFTERPSVITETRGVNTKYRSVIPEPAVRLTRYRGPSSAFYARGVSDQGKNGRSADATSHDNTSDPMIATAVIPRTAHTTHRTRRSGLSGPKLSIPHSGHTARHCATPDWLVSIVSPSI